MKEQNGKPSGGRNRLIWSILFFVIAALSVWAVTSQAKEFSPAKFLEYLTRNNPWWLTAAVLSMLSYIFFDALMIKTLLRDFGYPRDLPKCLSYASADIYFSAITPSGTGGQPMEAYFMFVDGVPGAISTAVVMTYLLFYTLSIVIVGLLSFVLVPGAFLSFGTFGRLLIIVGALIQTSLAVFYGLILWKKKLLLGICDWGLRVAGKLHFVKNLDEKREKLKNAMDQYSEATSMLRGRRKLMFKTLLFNLVHRLSQMLVSVFCFLAGGGALRDAPFLLAMQSNVVIGSSSIPTPGAMGVTDYLMINGFSSIMSPEQSANLELLSRTTSFYVCVLICGAIVLIKTALIRIRKSKAEKTSAGS